MPAITDPCEFLSDGSDSEEEAAIKELKDERPEEKKVEFSDLAAQGYTSESLTQSESYNAVPPPPSSPPKEPQSDPAPEAAQKAPPPLKAPPAKAPKFDGPLAGLDKLVSDLEQSGALAKAAERDRLKAGKKGFETTRQKNARKQKMGQANFTLKDDRDCTNPFVSGSDAPHVKRGRFE